MRVERRPERGSPHVTTTAVILDENSNVVPGPKSFPTAQLHANNDVQQIAKWQRSLDQR